MKEQNQLPKTIKFGDCELDVPSGVVVDGDRSTRLDPKSVDVAIYLAEHCDQLVSHDQLLGAAWPNKFVTESQLSKRITEIRQALGDNQKPHRYIETLPKRGYRLICPCEIVQVRADSDPAIEITQSSMSHEVDPAPTAARFNVAGSYLAVAMGMLVIVLGYFVYAGRTTQETVFEGLVIAEKSVAVLPFVDLSPDGGEQWYANGLAEQIRLSLSSLPELRVSASTSSSQFTDLNLGIPEIAMKLRVAYILEGSTRSDGDLRRVTARLIRADDGSEMWSELYNVTRETIFDMQEDIAESIATVLDVYLDDERREMMFQIGTRHAEAYEAYLHGVDIWTRLHSGPRTEGLPSVWDANDFFHRARELDPGFAAASLMHADAFIHVMLDGNESPALRGDNNPMHLAQAAQDLLLADLDQAAANANNPSLKLGIELQRAYFSPDWSRIPGLIASLRGQIDSYPWRNTDDGWIHPILNFLGEHEMARVLGEARLREDPFDLRGLRFLAETESLSGNLSRERELRNRIDTIVGNDNAKLRTDYRRALAGGIEEEVIRMTELYVERGNLWSSIYLAAIRGHHAEANQRASEMTGNFSNRYSYMLLIFHETGDRARSRQLTQEIDERPGGTAMFAQGMLPRGKSRYFNLADAPRFVANLKQAGIDADSLSVYHRFSTADEASR